MPRVPVTELPLTLQGFEAYADAIDFYDQDDEYKEIARDHYLQNVVTQADPAVFGKNSDLVKAVKLDMAKKEYARSNIGNVESALGGATGKPVALRPNGPPERVDSELSAFSKSVANGFARSYSETGEGAGLLIDRLEKNFGTGTQFGLGVTDFSERITNAINSGDLTSTDRPEGLLTQTGEAIGQLLGFIVGGGIAKIATTGGVKLLGKNVAKEAAEKAGNHAARIGLVGAGGAVTTQAMVADYLSELPDDQPIDQSVLDVIGVASPIIGALDAIVPGRFLNKTFLGKLSQNMLKDGRIANGIRTGVIEGTTEAAQSTLMNALAKATFDSLDGEERSLVQGAGTEGTVGGIAGFILGALGGKRAQNAGVVDTPPSVDTPDVAVVTPVDTDPNIPQQATAITGIPDPTAVGTDTLVVTEGDGQATEPAPAAIITEDGQTTIPVDVDANVDAPLGTNIVPSTYELSDAGGDLAGVTANTATATNQTEPRADQANTQAPPVELSPQQRQQRSREAADRQAANSTPDNLLTRGRREFTRFIRSGGELKDGYEAQKSIPIATGALRQVEQLLGGLRYTDTIINNGVSQLRNSVLKDYPKGKTDQATVTNLDRALKGNEEVLASLPQNTQDSLTLLRGKIDENSATIVERFNELKPRFAALVQQDEALLGEKKAKQGNNQAVLNYINRITSAIESRQGSYVHRTYLANIDKEFRKALPTNTEIQADARAFLASEFLKRNPSATEAEIDSYVETQINDILKTVLDKKTDLHATNSDALLLSSVDALKERTNVPPAIRKMLGEVRDPFVNYGATIKEQQLILQSLAFADGITKLGKQQGWLADEPNAANGLTHRIDTTGGNPASILISGLYMPKHIARGLTDQFDYDIQSEFQQRLNWITGLIKLGKTVYSPSTGVRNWLSAAWFLGVNGDAGFRNLPVAFETVGSILSGKSGSEYHKMLVEKGVVGDGISYQTLQQIGRDVGVFDNVTSKVFSDGVSDVDVGGSPFKKLSAYNRAALRFYQGADDFPKVIAFENIRSKLADANNTTIDDPAIIEEAAVRVRDTYPTYSKVNRLLKKYRGIPFSAPFISFPAEIYRTSMNWVKYVKQDLNSKNPQLRAYATKRMMSALLTGGATAYLGDVIASQFGVDEQDRDIVEKTKGKFEQGQHIIPIYKHNDNTFEVVNMSRYNPYSVLTDAIGELFLDSNADVTATVGKSVAALYSPFIQGDITATALIDMFKAIDGDASGDAEAIIGNAVSTFAKGVSPTILLQLKTEYEAVGGDAYYWPGLQKSPIREGVKILGATSQLYNLPQQVNYLATDYNRAKIDVSKRLNKLAKTPTATDGDIVDITNREVNVQEKWGKLLTAVDGLRTRGWTPAQIDLILKSSKDKPSGQYTGGKLNKEELKALNRNQPAPRIKYPEQGVGTHINRLRIQSGNEPAAALQIKLDEVREKIINRK